ncbi:MAG: class I SAM-dependent methyltransferase, partial [Thermoleophilia bacterium]|nr:class I SAM-dependent methyltransferase [Thermoleophilia bacterium]
MAVHNQMTERILRDSGLSTGMHVLDVGCGVGDVSFMVAKLVGESGHVLGLDRDEAALNTARARAGMNGLSNTVFALGDFCRPSPELGLFDAI